jgi:hypothetical protein
MKNKNLKTVGLSFLLGAFAATSFFAFSGFTNGESTKQAGQTTINSNEANILFKAYYQTANPVNDKLKGVCVDMGQYLAMKSIMNGGGETPSAFRVYFGTGTDAAEYGLVVGVDEHGADMVNSIYKTSAGNIGPCPNVCDVNSPITAN